MEGEWSYRGGQFYVGSGHFTHFNGGSGHLTQAVSLRENGGHVMEMSSIKKGEWLCGLFNGGGMMSERWPV